MRTHLGSALRVFLALVLFTGVIYPAIVTAFSQVLFSDTANGSLMKERDRIVGSKLLAQKFVGETYFHPRPSVGDYNTLSSGGSNLAPISPKLKALAAAALPGTPSDLTFASGSGLDPHIAVETARWQALRIAHARKVSIENVLAVVERVQETRQFGFLGEPRVNVLVLNSTLDRVYKP